MDFSVQSDGLREVEEARTAILEFGWDGDIPRALKRRLSSPTPQITTKTTPTSTCSDRGRDLEGRVCLC